jgi:hypothetical protein
VEVPRLDSAADLVDFLASTEVSWSTSLVTARRWCIIRTTRAAAVSVGASTADGPAQLSRRSQLAASDGLPERLLAGKEGWSLTRLRLGSTGSTFAAVALVARSGRCEMARRSLA